MRVSGVWARGRQHRDLTPHAARTDRRAPPPELRYEQLAQRVPIACEAHLLARIGDHSTTVVQQRNIRGHLPAGFEVSTSQRLWGESDSDRAAAPVRSPHSPVKASPCRVWFTLRASASAVPVLGPGRGQLPARGADRLRARPGSAAPYPQAP